MDSYIYYRVPQTQAQTLQTRVAAMQARLSLQYGMTAALKRRPEAKDGYHTWMEVYLAAPESFDTILAQAVVEAELNSLIVGERHTELFLDLSPCA